MSYIAAYGGSYIMPIGIVIFCGDAAKLYYIRPLTARKHNITRRKPNITAK